MSEFSEGQPIDSGDALEQLLSRATVRPMPDSNEVAAARDVIHSEWRKLIAGRRSRRHIMRFAIAASVLITAISVFGLLRTPGGDIVQVAAIQKSFGTIYLLSEQSELRQASGLAKVHTGQTIVTGEDAGIAQGQGAQIDGGTSYYIEPGACTGRHGRVGETQDAHRTGGRECAAV